MTIIETIWFSTLQAGQLGIVCAENEVGERKFYLGTATGSNVEVDAQVIVDWGAKLDLEYVEAFFARHKNS